MRVRLGEVIFKLFTSRLLATEGHRVVPRCFGFSITALAAASAVGMCNPATASANEQAFLAQVYLYAHPSVTADRLMQLGELTCAVRRSGQSTDDSKSAVWQSLQNQGVVSSNAEIGSLVHVAVDTLCPEVGYP